MLFRSAREDNQPALGERQIDALQVMSAGPADDEFGHSAYSEPLSKLVNPPMLLQWDLCYPPD